MTVVLTPKESSLSDAVWIDLLHPTPDEVRSVQQATGLRVPTQNEVSEIESTSRLGFENGAYYVSTPLVSPVEDTQHTAGSIGFVLNPKVLITVRFAEHPLFDDAQKHCDSQMPKLAEEAFLLLFERIVDASADALEHAGAECDELARSAFRDTTGHPKDDARLRHALRRVGRVAHRTSRVRDGLLGIGRIGAYVTESGIEGAPPVNPARIKAIRADVVSLTDYESHLSGKIQFLLDATLGFISIEQNEVVKTLTIASVVGIPPVVIAGIYGMNFHYMPELEWRLGYPLALGMMVLTSLLCVVWFRRRGWM